MFFLFSDAKVRTFLELCKRISRKMKENIKIAINRKVFMQLYQFTTMRCGGLWQGSGRAKDSSATPVSSLHYSTLLRATIVYATIVCAHVQDHSSCLSSLPLMRDRSRASMLDVSSIVMSSC